MCVADTVNAFTLFILCGLATGFLIAKLVNDEVPRKEIEFSPEVLQDF